MHAIVIIRSAEILQCIVPPLNCAKLPDHYINTNPTSGERIFTCSWLPFSINVSLIAIYSLHIVHKLTPYNIRGALGDSVTSKGALNNIIKSI